MAHSCGELEKILFRDAENRTCIKCEISNAFPTAGLRTHKATFARAKGDFDKSGPGLDKSQQCQWQDLGWGSTSCRDPEPARSGGWGVVC